MNVDTYSLEIIASLEALQALRVRGRCLGLRVEERWVRPSVSPHPTATESRSTPSHPAAARDTSIHLSPRPIHCEGHPPQSAPTAQARSQFAIVLEPQIGALSAKR
jgi:hypothetical protein